MIEGGCLCRAVRYRSSARPGMSLHCYCRQCQQLTGAGHASQFSLPKAETEIIGTESAYALRADSGHAVTSHYCGQCGSPLYKTTSALPEQLFFHAATLDDPAQFRPAVAVWTHRRQPWDPLDPAVPKTQAQAS